MAISGQEPLLKPSAKPPMEKGPRGRMKRLMLDTAIRLMQQGGSPSVSEVAEAAQVSRATAYRYFPSQAAMIQAAVDDALGPVLDWTTVERDAEKRVADLFGFAYHRMQAFEATHRAALLLALDQWQRRQAGTLGDEPRVVRGNRKGLLKAAVEPLAAEIGRPATDRVTQALSLLFGIEAIIILKDIWGLSAKEAEDVASWAAKALIKTAVEEAGEEPAPEAPREKKDQKKPRKKGAQA
ncbi:TetR/AcrR family transcriptional regulator [Kaistia dalseonensis]|nr:TetR/AcrR family transcriptional regulator [Kaistia dalseonensis]MCX5496010.1 TetR/AcrR family transcriptional regulator [Kaistia dalseonensis]